ncbi:MAG: UDP-N-acetylmuramate--L-alanine ligase [Oscillospiraceae bacterium]|jgi:UDP-N-acetylmuramate--alanine ligase|nr:UDP-N-acetylmuramate--L-alanine ligase [Oscillospiraceae bacterium]
MKDFLSGKKRVHFIGAGGSGMYPLARMLREQGFAVTGSDNNETDTLAAARKSGIKVFLGHSPENINGADLIIYSSAIRGDNPEILAAAEKNIEIHDRAQLLGLFTSRHDKAVCVAGTHGKTTVTSMLVHILLAAGTDISAFVGGKLKILDGGARIGKSGIMVCEACEFNDNFLKLNPNITLILNIDEDHMDYFKTVDNLRGSFSEFCKKTSDALIVNGDDENTRAAVLDSGFKGKIITFGNSDKNDYYPRNAKKLSDFESSFELYENRKRVAEITVGVTGAHNALNAVCACAAGLYLKSGVSALKEGLRGFTGASRRFERLAVVNNITVADDYAHHPAEIAATLTAAKDMNFKRVRAVHQPFTYSRTAALADGFAEALSIADEVTLTEIMGGREKNDYNIHSRDLAKKIKGCNLFATFGETADFVASSAREGDLIITMGCGDVNKVAGMIIDRLKDLFAERG